MWAERDLQYITNEKKENKFLCRTSFLGANFCIYSTFVKKYFLRSHWFVVSLLPFSQLFLRNISLAHIHLGIEHCF
jgi:hypothetical protein